jgi:hypothetical protein
MREMERAGIQISYKYRKKFLQISYIYVEVWGTPRPSFIQIYFCEEKFALSAGFARAHLDIG